MSKDKIQAVLDSYPDLCDFGFTLAGRGLSGDGYARMLNDERCYLLTCGDQFEKIIRWLDQVSKTKAIGTSASSYSLKHLCEKEIGYISNGLFIVAALHCGFKVRQTRYNSPNVFFNMSKKDIVRISKNN